MNKNSNEQLERFKNSANEIRKEVARIEQLIGLITDGSSDLANYIKQALQSLGENVDELDDYDVKDDDLLRDLHLDMAKVHTNYAEKILSLVERNELDQAELMRVSQARKDLEEVRTETNKLERKADGHNLKKELMPQTGKLELFISSANKIREEVDRIEQLIGLITDETSDLANYIKQALQSLGENVAELNEYDVKDYDLFRDVNLDMAKVHINFADKLLSLDERNELDEKTQNTDVRKDLDRVRSKINKLEIEAGGQNIKKELMPQTGKLELFRSSANEIREEVDHIEKLIGFLTDESSDLLNYIEQALQNLRERATELDDYDVKDYDLLRDLHLDMTKVYTNLAEKLLSLAGQNELDEKTQDTVARKDLDQLRNEINKLEMEAAGRNLKKEVMSQTRKDLELSKKESEADAQKLRNELMSLRKEELKLSESKLEAEGQKLRNELMERFASQAQQMENRISETNEKMDYLNRKLGHFNSSFNGKFNSLEEQFDSMQLDKKIEAISIQKNSGEDLNQFLTKIGEKFNEQQMEMKLRAEWLDRKMEKMMEMMKQKGEKSSQEGEHF